MIRNFAFAAAGVAILAACSLDPKQYETAPVTVQTEAGPVVCQLYTKDMVRWDRAISRPDNMSVETADAICLEEGRKQKSGETNSNQGVVI